MMIRIRGKVQKGASRGKLLGFPTANIPLHKNIEEGIYLSKVTIHIPSKNRHPQAQNDNVYNALTFIGSAKTFNEKDVKAESYLLDFTQNLYGKMITVSLLKKIRDNKKFATVEELIWQMNKDVSIARKFFSEWC